MSNDVAKTNQNLPATIYKPSELLGMFTAYLSRQDVNSQVIYLRGIYLKNPKHDPRWTYRYDVLRDEDTQTEITLQMTQKQSEELKDGNLVTVGGILGRRVQNNSHIQQDLFDINAEQFQKMKRLDEVIDRINRMQGSETIVLGSQQYTRKDGKADVFANAIKHDYRSPNPTTRWSDVIKLK